MTTSCTVCTSSRKSAPLRKEKAVKKGRRCRTEDLDEAFGKVSGASQNAPSLRNLVLEV